MQIGLETLTHVLRKMFDKDIIHADFQNRRLQGGTLGDVQSPEVKEEQVKRLQKIYEMRGM